MISPLVPLTYFGVRACAGTQPPFVSLEAKDQPTSLELSSHHSSAKQVDDGHIDESTSTGGRLKQLNHPLRSILLGFMSLDIYLFFGLGYKNDDLALTRHKNNCVLL